MSATSSVISHAIVLAVGVVFGMGVMVALLAAEARGLLHEPSGEIPEEATIRATATVAPVEASEPTEADDDVAVRKLQELQADARVPHVDIGRALSVGLWGNPYERLVEHFEGVEHRASQHEEPATSADRQSLHHLADLLVVLLTQLEIHGKRHGFGQTATNMVQLRQRAEAIRAELSPARREESPV